MPYTLRVYMIIIMGICFSITAFATGADREERTRIWMEEHPHSLPHWLTPEELTRLDEIGKNFFPTDPPGGPVRNIAEFEPMEGVLIRYPFGISTGIIAEMSEDVMVTTIVTGQSQENSVRSIYLSNGVNIDNCNFLHAPTNSYWTRDYGPWYVVDGSNQVGIVNFPYNRPRPDDDDIPIEMAAFLGIPLYGMDLEHTGGNYMTDGMGISASTTLVWSENWNMSHGEIDDMVEDYLGVMTYHVIPDPNDTYIDHIDCWGKFLDVDKVLIREVPSSHSQYAEIEETVDYFEAQTSSYETPYEIYRVYTPSDQPYTNSLILNDKVLVPITGSSWDDDALDAYETAMPGYEVLGFTGSWQSTDALHCRTKGIADRGMLYIHHTPIHGVQLPGTEYPIQVEIIPYSGEDVIPDSVYIAYRVDGGTYQQSDLINVNGYSWIGAIPGQADGTEIGYYIHAADESGREETHPFIGPPDPHEFPVEGIVSPQISITREYDTITLTWDPIAGVDYYTVYSSNSPFGEYTEDITGAFSGSSWSAPAPAETRYYRVTANTNSRNGNRVERTPERGP